MKIWTNADYVAWIIDCGGVLFQDVDKGGLLYLIDPMGRPDWIGNALAFDDWMNAEWL